MFAHHVLTNVSAAEETGLGFAALCLALLLVAAAVSVAVASVRR